MGEILRYILILSRIHGLKTKRKQREPGSPPPPLEALEEKIIGIVGKLVVDGIDPGAIDTTEPSRGENI